MGPFLESPRAFQNLVRRISWSVAPRNGFRDSVGSTSQWLGSNASEPPDRCHWELVSLGPPHASPILRRAEALGNHMSQKGVRPVADRGSPVICRDLRSCGCRSRETATQQELGRPRYNRGSPGGISLRGSWRYNAAPARASADGRERFGVRGAPAKSWQPFNTCSPKWNKIDRTATVYP